MNGEKITVPVPRGGKGGDRKRPPKPDNTWKDRLVRSREGEVKATPHNLLLILRHDPELQGLFAMDSFANRICLRRPAPWQGAGEDFGVNDSFHLAAWLGAKDGYCMSARTELVEAGVMAVAAEASHHPVREYLEGLAWDGVERIPTLFPKMYGALDSPYVRQVAVAWLISAVARIYRPACKVDFMLVLEGKQGAGKSSATNALFGDPWYAEAQEPPTSKDFYIGLQGMWCVEIAEMQAFAKAEVPRVKQAITQRNDTYRPPYGRVAQAFPRQCVFVGTTNEKDWQRDPTGARRYYPVMTGPKVDVAGVAGLRDQLWAEAVVRFKRNETWHEAPEGAAERQEESYQEDAWAEPITEWTEGWLDDKHYMSNVGREMTPLGVRRVVRTSMSDLLDGALGIKADKQGRAEQMRAAAVLRRLGWDTVRVEHRGSKFRYWDRPKA